MSTVRERVGPYGLQIPKVVLEERGFHEGMSVIVESEADTLRIRLDEVDGATIRRAALRYLLHHVGDAVNVSSPRRMLTTWQVDVLIPHCQRIVGRLTYTAYGAFLSEESTAPEEMLHNAHAA